MGGEIHGQDNYITPSQIARLVEDAGKRCILTVCSLCCIRSARMYGVHLPVRYSAVMDEILSY